MMFLGIDVGPIPELVNKDMPVILETFNNSCCDIVHMDMLDDELGI